MNLLDNLFGQVANTIRQHSSPDTPGPSYDSNPLLGALSGLFGQHAQERGEQFGGHRDDNDYSQYGNVKSSDEDPYGDPGLQGGAQGANYAGNYGGNYGNVKSSDEDPYGDPGLQG